MLKNVLIKLSVVAMAVVSMLAIFGNQVSADAAGKKNDSEDSIPEIRDGGPDSGFILFTIEKND